MKKLLVLLMLILSCGIANATSATIQPYQIVNFRTTVNQMIADAGVHGPTGNTGATGNQGIQGIQGNDGLNGTSVFNPMTSTGDMVYGGINGTPNRLMPNITINKKYLTMTGDGINGLSPTWSTLPVNSDAFYYLQIVSSDISTYKIMTVTPSNTPLSLTITGVNNGDTLANFATLTNYPNLNSISAGEYEIHIHASQTAGIKTSAITAELWEISSTGNDINKLGSFETSAILGNTNAEYALDFVSTNVYFTSSSNSRLAIRVKAIVSGAGTAPTIVLYTGNSSDTHLHLPTIPIDSGSLVPYSGAIQNVNLGSFNISANALSGNGSGIVSLNASAISSGIVPTVNLPPMSLFLTATNTTMSVTATTSVTTLYTYTLPANIMGSNGILKITSLWDWTNSTGNKTIKVNFGGSSFTNVTKTTNVSNQILTTIRNRNNTGLQVGNAANNLGFEVSSQLPFQSAIDTTSPVTITMTGQLQFASDTIDLQSVFIELIK